MNDLRKRLGIDDWLEIIKEDRVCNGAYISIAQYMYLLEKENQKYKEVIEKVINKLETDIEFCKNDSQGVYDLCNIAIAREKKILNILKEVEDK